LGTAVQINKILTTAKKTTFEAVLTLLLIYSCMLSLVR